jgi:hypothetical protein
MGSSMIKSRYTQTQIRSEGRARTPLFSSRHHVQRRETSGNRVFKDRAKAERWAARQEKSGVVKKVSVEEFVREPQIERLVFKKRRGSNMNWWSRALVLTAEVAINPLLRPCSELSIMQGLVLCRGQTCQATLERRCAELGSLNWHPLRM